jgi:Domain of unknown function (DUF4268)
MTETTVHAGSEPRLGRLAYVDPREVWIHEAHDLTPWLLENADVLSETLGIDLELTAAEHPVGGFSLDLFGRDLTNDAVLIVENQLEGTNHDHLGKLLTYAAGTAASTIVWIATGFRDEHRQALDWLNENTGEDVRFFGIVMQVVEIHGPVRAPLLKLVAEPNDWQKHVRAVTHAGRLEGKSAHYVEFWRKFLDAVKSQFPSWTRATKPNSANWFSMTSVIPGAQISCSFSQGGRLRHELYIDSGDGEANLTTFNTLLSQRAALEATYGRPLQFEELEGKRACRIADYTDGDVTVIERHDEFIAWFLDAGQRMRAALGSADLTTPTVRAPEEVVITALADS